MRLESSHWIVLTPGAGPQTEPSTVTFLLLPRPNSDAAAEAATATQWNACDLTTGEEPRVTKTAMDRTIDAVLVGPLTLTRTTVLHVAPMAAEGCAKPPASLWLPLPGYNYA